MTLILDVVLVAVMLFMGFVTVMGLIGIVWIVHDYRRSKRRPLS